MKKYKRVAAYVDLDAIEENFEAMKANLKEGTQIAAVVKANGYGHGAAPIARMIEKKDYLWGGCGRHHRRSSGASKEWH